MVDIIQRFMVIVSETVPSVPDRWEEFLIWFKPSTGELFAWTGSEWSSIFHPIIQSEIEGMIDALSSVYAAIAHSHPTHGDINFIGTISISGVSGYSGSFDVTAPGGPKTLTYSNGILTSVV